VEVGVGAVERNEGTLAIALLISVNVIAIALARASFWDFVVEALKVKIILIDFPPLADWLQ